jgi:hypothetical protein
MIAFDLALVVLDGKTVENARVVPLSSSVGSTQGSGKDCFGRMES